MFKYKGKGTIINSYEFNDITILHVASSSRNRWEPCALCKQGWVKSINIWKLWCHQLVYSIHVPIWTFHSPQWQPYHHLLNPGYVPSRRRIAVYKINNNYYRIRYSKRLEDNICHTFLLFGGGSSTAGVPCWSGEGWSPSSCLGSDFSEVTLSEGRCLQILSLLWFTAILSGTPVFWLQSWKLLCLELLIQCRGQANRVLFCHPSLCCVKPLVWGW